VTERFPAVCVPSSTFKKNIVQVRGATRLDLPLIFSFWFLVAAYVIHVLDESLL
jgi:hypothetical protein